MDNGAGNPIVEARNLSCSFSLGESVVHAVRDVSLAIYHGECVGLIGPSGCGKSTLLNMLGLVEAPSSGVIVFEGLVIKNDDERVLQNLRRAKVGYVFQAFNLLSTLSVRENVMLPCLLVGLTEREAIKRADDLLHELGLSHRANALPASLSGGEMQRVAIARAIAHKPALILADEPTGNLDSAAGEQVLDLLQGIHELGTPIVMATHSEAAMRRCSRVLRMRDGSIVHE